VYLGLSSRAQVLLTLECAIWRSLSAVQGLWSNRLSFIVLLAGRGGRGQLRRWVVLD